EFFSRYDGVELCCLLDEVNGEESAALSIVSIKEQKRLTVELEGGRLKFVLEGLEDVYVKGNYFVIAANDSEGTRLVIFTRGECDGESLAGRVCCVAMDPVLSLTEPVARSFYELLETFAQDPAKFLDKIGYCSVVAGKGRSYGAVADRYVADMGPSKAGEQV